MTSSDLPPTSDDNQSKLKRRRSTSTHARKVGLPAGSLVYVGDDQQAPPKISAIIYNVDEFQEHTDLTAAQALALRTPGKVTWINVDGIHKPQVIKEIGQAFGLHPLTMEDIVTTDQRSRREETNQYVYLVFKMLHANATTGALVEQVSLVLGKDFILTFQEQVSAGDVFDMVRERLRNNRGPIRKLQADFLMYALLDAVVDQYFLILESLGEQVETLENSIIDNPKETHVRTLYTLKREVLKLRRASWPLREVFSALEKDASQFIESGTRVYLRDVHDHIIHILDHTEQHREMLSSLLEIYLSSVSNRLNTVMKFLTLISTIFLPLSFIAGVYGMNFRHMPELEWQLGYPFALALMLGVAVGLLWYFRRRGWV
jgi:magnesium transporter